MTSSRGDSQLQQKRYFIISLADVNVLPSIHGVLESQEASLKLYSKSVAGIVQSKQSDQP